MNESTITAELERVLRRAVRTSRLPGPVAARATVLKHSDRYTAGIPDLTLSVGLATAWVETKHVAYRDGRLLVARRDLLPLQHHFLYLLRGYYFFAASLEHAAAYPVLSDNCPASLELPAASFSAAAGVIAEAVVKSSALLYGGE